MPLYTQIERDGNSLTLNWGWWHVQCMQEIAIIDASHRWGIDCPWHHTPLYLQGKQILECTAIFEDPDDGEILEFRRGDILYMHR